MIAPCAISLIALYLDRRVGMQSSFSLHFYRQTLEPVSLSSFWEISPWCYSVTIVFPHKSKWFEARWIKDNKTSLSPVNVVQTDGNRGCRKYWCSITLFCSVQELLACCTTEKSLSERRCVFIPYCEWNANCTPLKTKRSPWRSFWEFELWNQVLELPVS